MPTRFGPEIDQLRAAIRGTQGPELLTTVRRFLEAMPVPALASDDEGRYVASNVAARTLTGYTAGELAALTVTDLTPAPSSHEGARLWQDFIAQGFQRGEYELRSKTGRTVLVRYWAYARVAPGIHVSLLTPAQELDGV